MTGACLDEQCGAPAFAAGEAEAITAAAEAGDLELAQKLAAGHPTLRIFTAKGLIFNGPQLAGIAGPEATAEGEVRVACAGRTEATPAAGGRAHCRNRERRQPRSDPFLPTVGKRAARTCPGRLSRFVRRLAFFCGTSARGEADRSRSCAGMEPAEERPPEGP